MRNNSLKINTDFLPFWVKVLLIAALILQSSGLMLAGTFGAFQVSDSIDGNSVSTADAVIADDVVVVKAGDLADDKAAELLTPSSWFFYNDETDTINNTLGSFVSGPDTPPLGDGSAQISVTGSERRNLATYLFRDVDLADITELSFTTYNPSVGNGGSADRSAYLNFNVSFDGSDTWQSRLTFVPTNNDTVLQDTWQEWDAIDGGTALWGWSGFVPNGNVWPDGATSTLRTWDDLLASFPNISTRATDSWLGLRVGEPYADGYTENIDSFTFGVTDGWNATTTTYDFEPATVDCEAGPGYFDTFALGTVHGQEGWSSSGPFDQEVVTNTYGFPTFGCQTLRLSNESTSGSFADQTFSYSVANEAGETDALNNGMSGGTRQNHFEAEFDIATAMPTEQPGLFMSVSPDRGDGARMSYLSFTDTPGGIDVVFYDVTSITDPATFSPTTVATGLSRAVPHTIKFVMDLVDGPSNDVVEIYIDGALVHTGTSWENYFRYDDESNPGLANPYSRTVDSLLFRMSGSAVPGNDGYGYLVDNVELASSGGPVVPVLATDGDVVLNEFLPNSGDDDGDMPDGEWVELYNNEDFDIDLTGWYVTDASGGAGNTVVIGNSTSVTNISSGTTTIPANGFMVIYMNKPVFNNPGDTVKLLDGSDVLRDSYVYGDDICQSNLPTPGAINDDDVVGPCDENSVPVGKSFARFIDGTGPWVDPEPTPGEENRFSRQDLIDSGFSDEMIEGMVTMLEARGEYLIGEEPEEVIEAAQEVSSTTPEMIEEGVATTTPGVILEEFATGTPAVIDEDTTTGGGGGGGGAADTEPLMPADEEDNAEIKKDDDETDPVDQGRGDEPVLETTLVVDDGESEVETVEVETDDVEVEEPQEDESEETEPEPEPKSDDYEVVSEAE